MKYPADREGPRPPNSDAPVLFRWRQAIVDSSLLSTTRHVLLTLSLHMNGGGESCFPSTRTQAAETGLSERTIINHLWAARDAGWIAIRRQKETGKDWALHSYAANIPCGTEGTSAPKPEGTEGTSAPSAEMVLKLVHDGAEADDSMVLKQLQSSTSVSTSVSTPRSARKERSHSMDNSSLTPSVGEKKRKPHVSDLPGFDSFWEIYPKKEAKEKARKAWRKLNPNADLQATILRAVETRKKTKDWLKDDGQYVPYPASWLNGKRWKDELPPPTVQRYANPLDALRGRNQPATHGDVPSGTAALWPGHRHLARASLAAKAVPHSQSVDPVIDREAGLEHTR